MSIFPAPREATFAAPGFVVRQHIDPEQEMNSTEIRSLRNQVQKWLAPDQAVTIRVVKFGRLRTVGTRYVFVEVSSPMDVRSMYFFRHSDGYWYVCPPTVTRGTARFAGARPG